MKKRYIFLGIAMLSCTAVMHFNPDVTKKTYIVALSVFFCSAIVYAIMAELEEKKK